MSYQNFEYKDGSIDVEYRYYPGERHGSVKSLESPPDDPEFEILSITEVGTGREVAQEELPEAFLAEIIEGCING